MAVGDAVQAELHVRKVAYEGRHGRGSYRDAKLQDLLASSGQSANKVRKVNLRAAKLLEEEGYNWPDPLRAKLGAYLVGR